MIEFKMEGNDGVVRTKGDNAEILNELLSINLSVIKDLTDDKTGFDNLKDQFVILMTNDELTNRYFENSYSYIMKGEEDGVV